jgi:lipopolysaccharide/colanic/teichoic acid biosynthesis glycosyltransferase
MYKFRSMRQGKANESVFRGEEDRIFPFGRLIRATKLDELPQLINILIGDMSIVGPRPAAVDQVEITRGGRFAAAGEVTSGLTGPSALYDYLYGDQIESEEEYLRDVLPTRLELDLVYLDKRGVFFDLKMIWWTVVCIVYQLAGRVPEHIFNTLLKWAAEHRKEPVCAAN